jgi:hypothetical protein
LQEGHKNVSFTVSLKPEALLQHGSSARVFKFSHAGKVVLQFEVMALNRAKMTSADSVTIKKAHLRPAEWNKIRVTFTTDILRVYIHENLRWETPF